MNVIIKKPDGIHMDANIENDVLKVRGDIIKCSCTGKTNDTATPFVLYFDSRKAECPVCGKTLIIETKEEKLQRQRDDIKLVVVDHSISLGLSLYALTSRVDLDEWNKIKQLFTFYGHDDDDWDGDYIGWATTNPSEVEKILGVEEENTVSYRRFHIQTR
ncbi:MAG: hypothetical protein SVK08_01080 [Halobacteriota archaeon]|nr:hypothetical protein [Halobacteriota archaeon]